MVGFFQQNLFLILGSLSFILFILLIYLWSTYNSFIVRKNQAKTDLSDIKVQVKRRADLIERLAILVRDYATHEKGTFEEVARARSALDTSKTVKDTARAENMLTETLRSLFAVVENYPKLAANQNYLSLRDDLKETENLIAQYREEYNKSVQDYNNSIQTFPNLWTAFLFNFKEEEFFQP
ncbi:MAG: LemA family protein [bacterium]|nr:LemA family protein [bacterium]